MKDTGREILLVTNLGLQGKIYRIRERVKEEETILVYFKTDGDNAQKGRRILGAEGLF
jgi:hypothetical protein